PVAGEPFGHRFVRAAAAPQCHRHGEFGGHWTSSLGPGSHHRDGTVVLRLPRAGHYHDDCGGALMRSERDAMPLSREARRSDRGFTLIELIVALFIFSFVSLGAFSVLSSTQQMAVMNDQTVQVQRNVRLAMDLIARDVRMTGYGNPAAGSVAGCAQHLNATDQAGGADTGSDQIAVVTVDQQVGTLNPAFTAGNTITVSGLTAGTVSVNDVVTLDGAFSATVTGAA